MKIQSIFYCAALLLAVYACRQEEVQPEPVSGEVPSAPAEKIHTDFTVSLPGAATKTAVDMSSGIITWTTDDPVMVSNGIDQINMYIEQGGSTQAALYALDASMSGNEFYAVYPARDAYYINGVFQAAIPTEQKYVPGGFATETFPMIAKCDQNRNFAFRNAASLLKIETSGELPEEEKIYSVTVTATEFLSGSIAVQFAENSTPLVECTDGSYSATVTAENGGIELGEPIYVVVAPGNYESLKLKFTLTSGFSFTYDVPEGASVERSAYKTISVPLEYTYVDLSKEGTANCYVITEPGTYRFNASVRGNGVTTSAGLEPAIEGAVSAKIYYSDGGPVLDGALTFSGGYVYFTTVPEDMPSGTILVSVVDVDGAVLWSWQLWFNPGIADVQLSNGQIWMNMNLGAHQIEFNPAGYNGYYYQWGRKDPFLPKNTGTATDAKTLSPFVSGASRIDGSLENSIKNPHIFYGSYHPSGESKITADWSSYDDEVKVYDWWNANITGDEQLEAVAAKTMFDPCPTGYHVPTYAEINDLIQLTTTWSNNSKVVEGKLYFPTSSYRSIGIYKAYWDDPRVFFWSSTPSETGDKHTRKVYRPYYTKGGQGMNGNGIRTWGIPVRCISDDSAEPSPVVIDVVSVQLDRFELDMLEGESVQLYPTVNPDNATDKTVTWSSSDESVATVSADGLVQAIAEGTAVITATAGGKSATCPVTVSKPAPVIVDVTEVQLSSSELTLIEGESAQLTATVLPDNATDKTVTWTSSDEAIATVSADGIVKAIAEGTAVITATADGKSATCNVTVAKMVIDVTDVQLDKTELTLKEGEEYQLTATVLPDNATYKTVTWTSSKPEVATVSETGLVKAVAAGTVVITAKAGEKTATCTLKVAKSGSGSGGIEDMDPEEW